MLELAEPLISAHESFLNEVLRAAVRESAGEAVDPRQAGHGDLGEARLRCLSTRHDGQSLDSRKVITLKRRR
jgi:hypothetical protein